jgi:mono/diheme cytochrome c family protein
VVAGLVFLALALYASKFPAPLAPASDAPAPGFLPRPGAQFLWLFQLLKYLPGALASLVAVSLPLLLLGGLALLPLLDRPRLARFVTRPRFNAGTALFTLAVALVLTLTTLAYVEDARNPREREQLSKQARDEAIFRSAPFQPRRLRSEETGTAETGADNNAGSGGARDGSPPNASTADADAAPPPPVYTKNCAKCHGAHAEGKFVNPKLVGISAHPQRTVEDIVAILDDPSAYGLEPRMPSFARKLSDEDKRLIADWLVSLKPLKP